MGRFVFGAIVTFAFLAAPASVHAQDTAPVTSVQDGGALGPLVSLSAIDPDARAEIVKQLELRGYDPDKATADGGGGLDGALREFAAANGLESPPQAGYVPTRTIDELGAGRAVALRWGANGPRAPELTGEEMRRLNAGLRLRGYSTPETARVDGDTVASLRELQRVTGHPVQRGELIERRWLYILGVATDESIPFATAASAPGTPGR